MSDARPPVEFVERRGRLPKPNLPLGTIVSVPIDDEHLAYAQVVCTTSPGMHYWAALRGLFRAGEDVAFEELVAVGPVLLMHAGDILVAHDRWKTVARSNVHDELIPWPAFKYVTDSGTMVVDHLQQRARRATAAEASRLPNFTTVGPIRLEHTLRAMFGRDPEYKLPSGIELPAKENTATFVFGPS